MRHSKTLAMGRVVLLLGVLAPGWGICRLLLPEHRDLFTVALYAWILASTAACGRWLGPQDGVHPFLDPRWDRQLARGILIGLGMLAIQCALLEVAGLWHPVSLAFWVWVGFVVKALPLAMAEEFLFRGYLFEGFLATLPRSTAYAATCGLFAVAHIFRPGTWDHRLALLIGLFLASAALCRLVEMSGTLWPAIGVHSVWIGAMAVVPPASIQSGLLGGAEGDVAAGCVSWILFAALYALAPKVAGSACAARVRNDETPYPAAHTSVR